MSTINDTDQFLVQRGTTSHKQNAVNLMSTIQDTDLMLIQRGAESYKVTCLDVKDQLGGGGVSGEVNQPVVLKPKDGAGSGNTVYSLSDKITKIEDGGSYTCETDTISSVGPGMSDGNWSDGYIANDATNNDCSNPESSYCPKNFFNSAKTNGYQLGRANAIGVNTQYTIEYVNTFPSGEYSLTWNFAREGPADLRDFSMYVDGVKQVIKSGNFGVNIDSGTYTWTQAATFTSLKFECFGAAEGNAGIALETLSVDGTRLVDGTPVPIDVVLTFPTNKGFDCFAVGDVVQGGPVKINTIEMTNYSSCHWIKLDGEYLIGDYSSYVTDSDGGSITGSYNDPAAMFDGDTGTLCQNVSRKGILIDFSSLNLKAKTIQLKGGTGGETGALKFNGQTLKEGNPVDWTDDVWDLAMPEVKVISKAPDATPPTISVNGGDWDTSNQSEVWSNRLYSGTTTYDPATTTKNFSTPATLAFDGGEQSITYENGSSNWIYFRPSAPVTVQSKLEFGSRNTVEVKINGNGVTYTGGSSGWDINMRSINFSGALTEFAIRDLDNTGSSGLSAIKVDGSFLVDAVNDSQVWSAGGDGNSNAPNEGWSNAFNGVLAAPNVVTLSGAIARITFPSVPFTKIELLYWAVADTSLFNVNGDDVNSLKPTAISYTNWVDVTSLVSGNTLEYIEFMSNNADPNVLAGVKLDDKLLVDTGARDLGDNKLSKTTTYDTLLTVASSKDFASLSGGSWMTDGTGDPGPYSQTPYKLTTTDIESVDTVAWALDPDPSKTDLLLSNNNRTYTSAGGWRTGLSSEILSKTQESYFEFQLNNDSNNNGDHRLGILKDNGGYVPGDGAQASKPGDFDIIGYGNSVTGVGQPLQGRLLAKQNDVVKSQSVIFGDPFGGTSGQNDVIGFRVIPAENKVIAYKNGVEQGDLVAAALAALGATFDLTAGDWRIYAGKYESGSNVDLGSGGRITLTFPGDVSTNPDLQYFRAGDVVQSDWNQDQVWSTGLTTSSGWQSSDMPAGAFNGNVGDVFAQPNSATTIVFTPETPITYSTSVEVYAGGSDFVINGSISSSIDAGSWTKIEGSGTINTLEITPGGVPNLAAIRVDGLLLVDTGVENVNGTKVVSVDTANNQMVVDGGEWDDGSGVESFDILDQTYWDKGITDPSSWYNGDRFPSNMFDGLSTTNCSPIELTTFTADWTSGGGIAVTGALKIALFKHVAGECVINGLSLEDDPNWIKQSNQNDPNGSQGAADQVWINTSITVINSIQGSRPASGSKSGFLCKGLWDDNGWIVRAEVVPGDKNVEYQTKGGKGDIILADASNNTLRINNTGDSDNRWIAENKADVEFKIAGPSYVDSPLLTSHVELESSQFATTPAFDPNTGEPIDGLAKITWSLKPGDDAEYQLDAGTLNPYRPSGLQLNTTYTIKVKHTGARLGDSDWSLSTTFTTGASRTLNDHYMKQIKVLEEELREARSS